jgi:hypothetical protein
MSSKFDMPVVPEICRGQVHGPRKERKEKNKNKNKNNNNNNKKRSNLGDLIKKVESLGSDIIKIWYVGRLWCPELIPDFEKFLPVAIFKMATTILHKFNIVRF